jgi:hypothetical protein
MKKRQKDAAVPTPTKPPTPWFKFCSGVAICNIAGIALWQLGEGILGKGHLVDRLAQVEFARGLITYILALGTIAIAEATLVATVTGGEPAAKPAASQSPN